MNVEHVGDEFSTDNDVYDFYLKKCDIGNHNF